MQNNPIVQIDVIDNQPVISTLTVAQNVISEKEADVILKKNKQIIELINDNLQDFEEFGKVRFQTAPSIKEHSSQNIKIAELNDEQYFLLMTYQRNTPVVRDFKIKATKAFFLMKERLTSQTSLPHGDIHPLMVEIVKSNQATTEAVVKMGEGMQTLTRHFMEINNEVTRMKVHTRETLNEMNHNIKNMYIGVDVAQRNTEQGMLATEAVLEVVEKLEIYYRRDTLTSTQQQQMLKRIDERARELASEHGIKSDVAKMSLFVKLKNHFDVPMYSAIKSESFARALQVIDDHSLTYEECGE
jgi:hypothetical protein